ncbi:MAG: hypothetical protein K0R72_205 [Clostridia bacterium]|nr:hypothetical protein [Clostridia bacterium]
MDNNVLLSDRGKKIVDIRVTGAIIVMILTLIIIILLGVASIAALFDFFAGNTKEFPEGFITLIVIMLILIKVFTLANKKITLYENCICIQKVIIKYSDIYSVKLIENDFNLSENAYLNTSIRNTKFSKEKYLVIRTKDNNCQTFFIGQFSNKKIKLLLDLLVKQGNCIVEGQELLNEAVLVKISNIVIITVGSLVSLFIVFLFIESLISFIQNK